jgi:glutathione S-transferase
MKNLLLGVTDEEQAGVLQWMFFAQEHIHKEVCLVYYGMAIGFKPYDAALEAKTDALLVTYLAYLENLLSKDAVQTRGSEWLVKVGDGVAPSLADLSVASALRIGVLFAIEKEQRDKRPNLMAWWNKIVEIPAFKENFQVNNRPLCEKRKFPLAK